MSIIVHGGCTTQTSRLPLHLAILQAPAPICRVSDPPIWVTGLGGLQNRMDLGHVACPQPVRHQTSMHTWTHRFVCAASQAALLILRLHFLTNSCSMRPSNTVSPFSFDRPSKTVGYPCCTVNNPYLATHGVMLVHVLCRWRMCRSQPSYTMQACATTYCLGCRLSRSGMIKQLLLLLYALIWTTCKVCCCWYCMHTHCCTICCRWTSSIKQDSLLPCHQAADAVITAVSNGVSYTAVESFLQQCTHWCTICVLVTSSIKWLSSCINI